MALVIAWTSVITEAKRPVDAVIPTVPDLVAPNKENFEIDLTPASTYDNSDEAAAFTAIGDAVEAEISSNYIVDVFGLDTAGLDVTANVVIQYVERRWDNFEAGDLRAQYTAAVDIFRVKGYVAWTAAAIIP